MPDDQTTLRSLLLLSRKLSRARSVFVSVAVIASVGAVTGCVSVSPDYRITATRTEFPGLGGFQSARAVRTAGDWTVMTEGNFQPRRTRRLTASEGLRLDALIAAPNLYEAAPDMADGCLDPSLLELEIGADLERRLVFSCQDAPEADAVFGILLP